jgi:two-component system, NtrC family, sensor histidine kinase HydH
MKLGVAAGVNQGLAGRLAYVTGARLAFLALLLAATGFLYLRGDLVRYPTSQSVLLVCIGLAFALAAAYAVLLRRGERLDLVAIAQVVLDQLTWTAIVYVSGGPSSGAVSFYALTCLVGASLIGLRGAAIAASVGITLYGSLCMAFASSWILPPLDQDKANYVTAPGEVGYLALVNGLGIVVVALLAGWLAERLRKTGGELADAMQRALAAERLAILGRMAAGLAHEIRNPLGAIAGSAEMLRSADALSDEDKRLCDIIQRETSRLNQLVGDMLDLGRPRPLEPRLVDVGQLAGDVVGLARGTDRGASGDVTIELDGPAAGLAWVTCDAAQMKQVLWNLVRNGVQASGAGARVRVSIALTDDAVTLAVSDEGPGIAADAREKIFDADYTTRTKGTGVGLAVVRRIIDEHAPFGARIEVESGAEGGAVFTVRLRRAKPPSPSTPDLSVEPSDPHAM